MPTSVRPASDLADFARKCSGVGDPLFHVMDVARAFGLRVQVVADLEDLGSLGSCGDELVVRVRDLPIPKRRFTVAHEIAHFLLASEESVSLTTQRGDRGWERYCNAFASHLFLPRRWLRSTFADMPQSLSSLNDLADASGCSIATAAGACLNTLDGWDRLSLMWWRRSGTGWLPVTVLTPRDLRPMVEVTAETTSSLDMVVKGNPCSVEVPLVMDGEAVNVAGQAELHHPTSLVTLLSLA